MILWGPPGTGKTTIARLLAKAAGYEFQQLSAVFSGVADLKKAFEAARRAALAGQATLLFVDEIHRFNRAQQDGFLPFVEEGTVTLVGATTENPSFELNGALLSRCQVYVLRRLDDAALESLLAKAEALRGPRPAARARGARGADRHGRRRRPLSADPGRDPVQHRRRPAADTAELGQVLQKRSPAYDKDREEHYNLISALHKSVRGSDPDAALYWLARMLEGGEDPLFIARRLVRMASEDIGEADPLSLLVAIAAKDAYDFLGCPEGELALAQACVHLAAAPKSNAVYKAFGAALPGGQGDRLADAARPHPQRADPADEGARLRQGLRLRPGHRGGLLRPELFPRRHGAAQFYQPKGEGAEARVKERLERWAALRARKAGREQDSASVRSSMAEGRITCIQAPRLRCPSNSPPTRSPSSASWSSIEDAHVLALNKPSGLSSQGGRGQVHTLDELLWAFAKSQRRSARGWSTGWTATPPA